MENDIDYKRVAQAWSAKLCELMAEPGTHLQKEQVAIASLLRELAKEDAVGIFCSMSTIADTAIETIREQKRVIDAIMKENKKLEEEVARINRMKSRVEIRARLAEKKVDDMMLTVGSSESEFVVAGTSRSARTPEGARSPMITTQWGSEEV